MAISKSKRQSRKKPNVYIRSLAKRRHQAEHVIKRLKKGNPKPKTDLQHRTPYQFLVSVVLSAQATDKVVNSCMSGLYEKGFNPRTVIKLGQKGLEKRIKKIGLAPTKSKNVFNLTKILIEKYNEKVPSTREELEALPGVGRKTASVILGELFKQPTIAVDTHVFRVSARLGLQDEKTPEKAELALLKVVDKKHLPFAHHWLILHGRSTCKAINPKCDECVLSDLCPSKGL